MADFYLIGIDQGTQSTKSVIYDTDGDLLAEASQPVALLTPRPNWVEQDVEEVYRSVTNTLREAVTQSGIDPKQVKAIGLDSQICSLVRIDEDWNALGPIESYLDTRCQTEKDWMMASFGDEILDQNGISPYICPKLLWLKENSPAEYRRTYKALMVNGYLAGRLAGLGGDQAYIDTTCMGGYGWGDLRTFSWSPALAGKLQLDLEKAPRLKRPTEVIGELSVQAAAETGLVPGIPIAAGLGDAIAGWLGVGAVEPGIVVDTSGTSNHIGICVDRYQPDTHHKVLTHYPSAIPGQWYPIGYTAGTGRSHSWFIDELCLAEEEKTKELRNQVYAALEEAASALPVGSEGLIFIPHFGGRLCPYQPNVRGAWLGLTWKHTRAHLYRAILESIAYEYYSYHQVALALYPELELKRVIVIGGGARSVLWNEMKANVLGVPHALAAGRSDFAPLGAVIVAGHAVGLFPDMAETARRFTQVSQEVQPDPAAQRAYRPYAEFYVRLFEQIEPIFNALGGLVSAS